MDGAAGELRFIEEALRRKICAVCFDRNADGICLLSECALSAKFPLIAASISRIHSDYIEDYVTAIREDICAVCPDQDRAGDCVARDEGRCMLDRYLPLIVDAIQEARGVTLQFGSK